MITQTVKADAEWRLYLRTTMRHGWWGFAALNTADYTLTEEGSGEEKGC